MAKLQEIVSKIFSKEFMGELASWILVFLFFVGSSYIGASLANYNLVKGVLDGVEKASNGDGMLIFLDDVDDDGLSGDYDDDEGEGLSPSFPKITKSNVAKFPNTAIGSDEYLLIDSVLKDNTNSSTDENVSLLVQNSIPVADTNTPT